MVTYTKIILYAAVAASTLASTASAGGSHKYGSCPDATTPPTQDPTHWGDKHCPEGYGISAVDMILCSSGSSGFDHRTTDHDIMRSLIFELGLEDTIDGLRHGTCFIPTDEGVHKTAEALGFHTHKYNEEGALEFLKKQFSPAQLTQIVKYHLSDDEEYTFRELQKHEYIGTLEGESIMLSEPAGSTPNCDKRVKLLDEYRKYKPLSQGNAKIHNRYRDLTTTNCIFHVTKSLSLPAAVLPGHATPTSGPTSPPTDSPTSGPTPTPATVINSTRCGTELTMGEYVLEDDLVCAVANPGNDEGSGCDTSSICLGVGASLDCQGRTISKAGNVSIDDGLRMLTDSALVNCAVTGFEQDDGIQVVVNATGVSIENVTVSGNGYGIYVANGSVTLKSIVANNNRINGLVLGGNVTFDGIEACQNGRRDLDIFSTAFLSGSGATYDSCFDENGGPGQCPTPKSNCTASP